jgi:putative ABC transport system permease protein
LPLGWLQLVHNKTRLTAALAGVVFANVLVFMQLGFLGALVGSIQRPYDHMNADVLVSAADMNTLADGSPLPRRRMFQALAVEGVASATTLYYGKLDWRQPDGSVRNLDVFGVDPSARAFESADVEAQRPLLAAADAALIDRKTRNVPTDIFTAIERGEPLKFEAKGRTLSVVGTFSIGGGFSADGYLIVSDQTFLRLFPQRSAGAPNHVLVRLVPGADIEVVAASLRAALSTSDTVVRSVTAAVAKDQGFQTKQRPVGLVFGFGVVIGVLVGVIIVYQVLSTDVSDHLKEYATFKAIGYAPGYFLSVIFEEAMVLAALGFVPGIAIALGLYALVSHATGLPLSMTAARAAGVFVATAAMCGLSGFLATRRLARANPADLY